MLLVWQGSWRRSGRRCASSGGSRARISLSNIGLPSKTMSACPSLAITLESTRKKCNALQFGGGVGACAGFMLTILASLVGGRDYGAFVLITFGFRSSRRFPTALSDSLSCLFRIPASQMTIQGLINPPLTVNSSAGIYHSVTG